MGLYEYMKIGSASLYTTGAPINIGNVFDSRNGSVNMNYFIMLLDQKLNGRNKLTHTYFTVRKTIKFINRGRN